MLKVWLMSLHSNLKLVGHKAGKRSAGFTSAANWKLSRCLWFWSVEERYGGCDLAATPKITLSVYFCSIGPPWSDCLQVKLRDKLLGFFSFFCPPLRSSGRSRSGVKSLAKKLVSFGRMIELSLWQLPAGNMSALWQMLAVLKGYDDFLVDWAFTEAAQSHHQMKAQHQGGERDKNKLAKLLLW